MHRAQRLCAVGFGLMVTREQVNQVKVRRGRQCAAAQSPQRQYHQLAPRHAAMRVRKGRDGRAREHANRRLCHPRIARRHRHRIGGVRHNLHAECKALLPDHPPHMIEQRFIGTVRITRRHASSQRIDIAHRIKRARINQCVEQLGPRSQRVGQKRRMAQDRPQQHCKRGLRFQEPKEIDRTG